MVQRANKVLINGKVGEVVTDDINKDKMFKYLWGKNKHWNDDIFDSIDWEAIGASMKKLAATSAMRVTNVLKLVHGWQNDGQQKELFYEDCEEEVVCPTGCGKWASRMYFIQCTAGY